MASLKLLLPQDQKRIYEEQGYLIVNNHLPLPDCQILTQRAQEQLRDLIFRDYPPLERPDLNILNNRKLLIEQKVRKESGYSNNIIWENGLSRRPYWSKNTGMVNIFYDQVAHEKIHFNPQTFQIISNLYGHKNLTYTRGMDRLSVKYKGCTAMPTHLDYHLFININPDPERVQAFVCVSSPEDVPVNVSGTIQVIPYFHHYWSIAQRYFRWDGPHQLSSEEYKDGLPQPLGKQFNQELTNFNLFLQNLHCIRERESTACLESEPQRDNSSLYFSEELESYRDLLETLPSKYYHLEWKAIKLKPGDLFCWNQKLPHGSLANKSDIPRIVYYVTLLPRPDRFLGYSYDWSSSKNQENLIKTITRGVSDPSEIVQGSNRSNDLERKYLRSTDFSYWYRPTQFDLRYFNNLAEYESFCNYLQGM